MAIYGIGSIVIDGLKLYGLINGLSGGKVSGSTSTKPSLVTPTTPTPTTPIGSSVGIPSSGSTIIWGPIQ